eukprot:COSAG03_NODE_2637_length_2574_cov_1.429091_2_plen_107_part_00
MPVVNRAAFAAGVLPPDTSASPRELQLQRDELLEFLGELEEAGVFAAAQQAARAASTPVARDCGQSAPPPVCVRACVCVCMFACVCVCACFVPLCISHIQVIVPNR